MQLTETTPTPSTGFSYIARKSCGCIVGVVADDPNQRKRTARRTSEWIQAGYAVERVTDEVVRQEYKGCSHRVQPRVMFE